MEKHKELAESLVRTALGIKFSEDEAVRRQQKQEMWALLDDKWEAGLLKFAKLDKLMSKIGSNSKLKVECDQYWCDSGITPVFIEPEVPFKEDMRELNMLVAQEEREELEKTLLAEAAAREAGE